MVFIFLLLLLRWSSNTSIYIQDPPVTSPGFEPGVHGDGVYVHEIRQKSQKFILKGLWNVARTGKCVLFITSLPMPTGDIRKGVFIATQLNWTQLNSTDPVEQRTAKSVMFLFMTSRPTNWVNGVTTFIDRWQLFTLWTCRQLDVELSSVELSWVELSCVA